MEFVISGILVHDGWNINVYRYTHDIALIKLNKEIKFNEFIRPICLPNDKLSRTGNGIVAGYGLFNETRIQSDVPIKVELPIISKYDCYDKQQSLASVAWEESFCAGRNDAGVCPGDSGSGFYIEYKQKFYLRGIVSSAVHNQGYNCTHNNYAFYSDAQKYMKTFIEPVSKLQDIKYVKVNSLRTKLIFLISIKLARRKFMTANGDCR